MTTTNNNTPSTSTTRTRRREDDDDYDEYKKVFEQLIIQGYVRNVGRDEYGKIIYALTEDG
jgi:hypothetical protein